MLKVREQGGPGQLDPQTVADLARAFEESVVDTLVGKSLRALQATGSSRLVVAGGVSANKSLRERLAAAVSDAGAQAWYPRPAFCTDNAAMVAHAGFLRLSAGERFAGRGVGARARWPLDELSAPAEQLPN
jgi:N6-L-threonylcarbamoyladenine synthase